MVWQSKYSIINKDGSVAVLDIGTTKIVCFIAHVGLHGDLKVVGIGHQLSKGIRSGVITDVTEAETSIVAAVHAAEQMAETTIENVVVSLSGGTLLSRNMTMELEVSGQKVSAQDTTDIIREAQASVEDEEYEIIHTFPVSYYLDAARGIRDPKDMVGEHLGGDIHLITVPKFLLRNIENCVARCHLNIADYVVAPHASALACLEADEMDLGVTLVDMGGGVTSFSLFTHGKNTYTDAAPIGGIHVTSDIAKGLSTTLAQAERLKTLHGSAIVSAADERTMIDVPQIGEDEDDDGTQMPRSMLVGIIRPRLEEIFEMVRGKIEASGFEAAAGRRVVLTGGASQLLGVRDLAARVLGKQIRPGKPKSFPGLADAVSGTAFSTSIGMLEYVRRKIIEERLFDMRGGNKRVGRVMRWLKQNF